MSAIAERLSAALSDRYRIERELGAGGMATVYLAQDLKHDRHVALKVLKPELAAVLGAERFVVEIKTTASLQHPHILPLFDSGAADGFLYYVMPFIDGETLRSKLDRETQLGIDEAVKIAANVADALDYAHRHGVIHRDIKPENILLHDGRPMVADFGIALAVSAAAGGRMTETGLSLGTPHYMSPEQATAEKELTNRSDIYSLGCVLYEMLTGNPPHTGASVQQIIMKIVTDEARPVTELRKSVPVNVAAALAKAVEKLPADRFESAKVFAEALENPTYTTAGPGAPRDAEMPIWEVVYPRSGPWVLFRAENRGSDLYAIRPGVDSAPTPLVVTDAGERMPALSPDGRWLAYVSDVSGRQEIYVRPFPHVTEATWQVSTTGGSEPRWAQSGRELFFRNEAGELVAVPVPPGATFEWGVPQSLFSMKAFRTADNGRMWDVAPGDQRFLMLRLIGGDTSSELIVVENFFEELKTKVPR